jgi:C-terminal proteasome-interacting domain of thioredoxin-like.
VLFDSSKPSSLNGKGKSGSSADWVESDTDEQLMLYIPFQSSLKIHSLHVTSLPPSSDDDDVPMRPKTLRLYTNRSHVLGFEEAEDIPPCRR